MSKTSNKEKRVTVRLTNSRYTALSAYAKSQETSLSQAIDNLVDAGLKAEQLHVATKEDVQLLASDIKQRDSELEKSLLLLHNAIENQPLVTQQLAAPTDAAAQQERSRLSRAVSILMGKD